MNKPIEERRRASLTGLLDSAIRTINQLAQSPDNNTRMLAGQAIGSLQRMRSMLPARRELDRKTRT
jgi:hypothetical protein